MNNKPNISRYDYALEIISLCKKVISNEVILEIDSKANDKDLVTNIDKSLNTLIVEKISCRYDDNIIGEEALKTGDLANNWYIDPIDGTTNFIYRKRDYAVSIAYEGEEGRFGLVYDGEADKLYHANNELGVFINGKPFVRPMTPEYGIIHISQHDLVEKKIFDFASKFKGIRDLGVCSIEVIKVVLGEASCFYRTNQEVWDYKAANIFAELSGVDVKVFDDKTIVVGTAPSILSGLIEV